jgi:hypothetical protein
LKRKNQKNQKKLKRKSSKKNDDIPSQIFLPFFLKFSGFLWIKTGDIISQSIGPTFFDEGAI